MCVFFGRPILVIINNLQEEILRLFFRIQDSPKFYLAGGTALAYFYLRHRRSEDLDFFTATEGAVLPFSRTLGGFLKERGFFIEDRRSMHSFCELFVTRQDQSTIIHLAQDASFRFEPAREFKEYPGLNVDNLKDIASNKLLALFGRAALRDFIDVYFLIKKANFTKEQLTELASKKDPGFDLYWLGVALAQIHEFKPASLEDMVMLIERARFEDIAVFFSEWRDDIIKQLP